MGSGLGVALDLRYISGSGQATRDTDPTLRGRERGGVRRPTVYRMGRWWDIGSAGCAEERKARIFSTAVLTVTMSPRWISEMSAEDKKSKAKIPRVVMPEQDAEARRPPVGRVHEEDRPAFRGLRLLGDGDRPLAVHLGEERRHLGVRDRSRERAVVLETPLDNPVGRVRAEMTALVGARVLGEHLHPGLIERFTVLEGQLTVRRDGKKVGRNDPCPCGSGKKYKKCCLPKEEEAGA